MSAAAIASGVFSAMIPAPDFSARWAIPAASAADEGHPAGHILVCLGGCCTRGSRVSLGCHTDQGLGEEPGNLFTWEDAREDDRVTYTLSLHEVLRRFLDIAVADDEKLQVVACRSST